MTANEINSDFLLSSCSKKILDEAHVETSAAAHRGNVDDFDVVAVQVVAHKACEQMLQRMDAFFGQDFFVGNAKAQVEYGNGVAFGRSHGFRHAHGRGVHTGVVNLETV